LDLHVLKLNRMAEVSSDGVVLVEKAAYSSADLLLVVMRALRAENYQGDERSGQVSLTEER
jgi:hypothetical protein